MTPSPLPGVEQSVSGVASGEAVGFGACLVAALEDAAAVEGFVEGLGVELEGVGIVGEAAGAGGVGHGGDSPEAVVGVGDVGGIWIFVVDGFEFSAGGVLLGVFQATGLAALPVMIGLCTHGLGEGILLV